MLLHVVAVGRLKTGPERELCLRYAERLQAGGRSAGFAGLKITELAESAQRRAEDRMAEEARAIDGAVPAGCARLVFDERGQGLDSIGFAHLLRDIRAGTAAGVAAIVGGPDGLAASVRGTASMVVSFGRLTMPHQIVRALVLEQLYRATTILSGHPYHRV